MHMKFCKYILGVKKSTNNNAILGELGRFPFHIIWFFRIFRYWIKILKNKESLLYNVYCVLRTDADSGNNYNGLNWASNVKKLLETLGLFDVWLNQDFFVPSFNVIRQRICDNFLQTWNESINDSVKLHTYSLFKKELKFEKYLDVIRETSLSNIVSRFRLSSHELFIETGRYSNIPRQLRICKCCNMNVIENEFHFLLVCPLYRDLRKIHFKNYFCHWPTIYRPKFNVLLMSQSEKVLYNLSKYLRDAFKLRESYIEQL